MQEWDTKNLNTPEYWDKLGTFEMDNNQFREFHYRFDIIIKYVKLKRLIDVGCGHGAWCRRVNSSFDGKLDVWGIDFSPVEIETCKKLSMEENYDVQDIYDIKFESKSFDTVTCCEVLEHLKRPEIAIEELIRICKSDGVIIITTPYKEIINQEKANSGEAEHIQSFDEERFHKLFDKYGDVKFDYFRNKENILVVVYPRKKL